MWILIITLITSNGVHTDHFELNGESECIRAKADYLKEVASKYDRLDPVVVCVEKG